ncbi:hypothetical protein BA768_01215 [Chryseobacterium sp. CBo1]|uniref:S24 family peptidase n=1 Tax=Chryseobacterium sp. CBo1 TaxID=1869230 RepID=UPI000810881F|nr:S24 family peptidase [Chryseobacterium sp. CBo1]OCK53204.1 hypothetical protein BA768_01215 [Chryseobacterium sp. CBo1]
MNERDVMLKKVLELIKKHDLTAYEIGTNVELAITGVQKIIDGVTQRPQINTLKVIYEYIIKKYESDINSDIVSELKPKNYATTLEVKIVTTKARAGYADAYYAEEYLADLPTVLIEADKEYKGKYLAFEVDGDSMEPDYNKGDIVICREVQRHLWQYKLHFKDYDFVIAHGTKGIMLKEIIDHNVETGEITCHSLNNDDGKHEDFVLNLREVAFLYNVVEHRISGKSKRRNR